MYTAIEKDLDPHGWDQPLFISLQDAEVLVVGIGIQLLLYESVIATERAESQISAIGREEPEGPESGWYTEGYMRFKYWR